MILINSLRYIRKLERIDNIKQDEIHPALCYLIALVSIMKLTEEVVSSNLPINVS